MCGILGLIGTPWAGEATAMLEALACRGPDQRDRAELGEALLGHTRLAVIDITGGHQPMRSSDGRYALVFNGEIYNFRELRAELEAGGCDFRTRSDTEVLIHGYAVWGERMTQRLDGMFAFAVWDTRTRTLYAARDRLGIKPFFYSTASGFAFASTLAPFLRLRDFPRQLDYEALRDFLAYQTPLAPHSFLSSVRQLPPASHLRWSAADKQLWVARYWDIPQPTDTSPDREEVLAQLDAALAASVRAQLVADVPLGAFLSGGIDSSLIVHYMARSGAQPIKTFSMRFDQAGFDETPQARAVAAHYGTDHHVLEAPDIDGDAFARSIGDLDQPLADPAYVMTHALARETRRHVTVALSGDGGDELFGGYARYRLTEDAFPRRAAQDGLRRLAERGLLPGALLRRTLHGQERLFYRQVELGPWPVSRKSLRAYLTEDAWRRSRPERTLERWRELALSFGGRMDTDSLMRADLWTYLSENCLVKTDRASMAHSLEVRVPYLGNTVLDAALAIPAGVHYSGAPDKALLRALARAHLPAGIGDRPKHGFSVPLRALFAGAWREVGDAAVSRAGDVAPFLSAKQVRAAWESARRGKGSARLAYTLLVLLIWLSRHRLVA